MPELAAAAEVETPSLPSADGSIPGRLSVTGELTAYIDPNWWADEFGEQARSWQRRYVGEWAATPPPTAEATVTQLPPAPGEISRTSIVTQAGVAMTVIVAERDFGQILYHVITNGITPALHLQRIVSRELEFDVPTIHEEVINLMVREVQERVLADRQRVTEAMRQRQMVEAEQRMRTMYGVPSIQFATTQTTTVSGIYNTNYFASLNWYTAGTAGTYGTNVWANANYAGTYAVQTAPLSEEEQAKIKARLAEEEKQVAEANKRAEQLLLDLLGEMGFARYKRKGYVLVMSRTKPGTVYRVRGMAGIDLYERNKRGKIISLDKYLCIHPREHYPEADTIAAQVMLCRHDEDTLWKTANIHKRNGYQIAGNFAA